MPNFTDDQWEVMTEQERNLVSSIIRYCNRIGCTPTDRQKEVLDNIDDLTNHRLARRGQKLEE